MTSIEQLTPEEFFDYYYVWERPLDCLEFDSEHVPFEYLQFARQDLQAGEGTRNIINAVGNAKRALHLQVETICVGYGYKAKSKDFPPKLDFLRDTGVAAPKVLSKLNKIRNRIEHDYYCPTVDEANDFIDIVELFLYATLSFIVVFPEESVFLLGDGTNEVQVHEETGLPTSVKVRVERNTGKFSVCSDNEEDELVLIVQPGQENYFEWIRKLFAHLFSLPL
jgi:hypothetical protein